MPKYITDFQKALVDDEELKGLQKKLDEKEAELNREYIRLSGKLIGSLPQAISHRKKQLAFDSGLAVFSYLFPKTEFFEEDGMQVYKKGDEKYTYCRFCDLYIRELRDEHFNDMQNRSLGVHEAGIKYFCPVCDKQIGKKVSGFCAND